MLQTHRKRKKNRIRAYCNKCRHEQVFIKMEINHILHLVLTIITVGLWGVCWVAICLGKLIHPWRCEHCGWHWPEFGIKRRFLK